MTYNRSMVGSNPPLTTIISEVLQMIGKRLKTANKIAKRIFNKYDIQGKYNDYLESLRNGITFPPEGAYRKTKVFCSNPYCCGNRRGSEGPSIQEKRFEQSFKEEETLTVSPSW